MFQVYNRHDIAKFAIVSPMSIPDIASEFQYCAIRIRITALDDHLRAIRDLRDLAATNRALARIEDEDIKDLAPLEDALSDISWTRERLRDAAGEWEDLMEYGQRHA